MEQFVLVPASVYNKNLITQSVTKQEFPKYQASQNSKYRTDSLKEEINKNLFPEADSLMDKILSCPRIKLSIPQTSFLDCVEAGFFLLDFAQQPRRKTGNVSHVYFFSLDAAGVSPTLILNQNAKAKLKREEVVSLSKPERQKLQRLYTQGGAAYGSVRNLVKTSNLSVPKVRQFLHSEPSYTKLTLATRKFKRLKTFPRFKNEIWSMELAYVDKLAKDNNGVKYLLLRQDLFDGNVDEKK